MHIGLVGGNRPDGFQENIGDALASMGHRVSYLGSTAVRRGRVGAQLSTLFPAWSDRHHLKLARGAHERECDAVITVQGDLSPEAVSALRRHGISVALWFPDAVCNLGRQRMLVAPYSALFFKDPLLVERLRKTLGLPVWYLPQACNPRWHRPTGSPGTDSHVVVVGNSYPSRVALLRRLHEAGLPLAVYGAAVPEWLRGVLPRDVPRHRPVYRQEKARVFRNAAAVLNNLHPAEMHGVNLRLFEATAAGGAVLCERRPVLAELYDPDTEVVAFDDVEQVIVRARELLADPELSGKIGDAASVRAHSEHTYQHRLPAVLEVLS